VSGAPTTKGSDGWLTHIGRSGRRPAVLAMRVAAQLNLVMLCRSQPGAVSPRRADRRLRALLLSGG